MANKNFEIKNGLDVGNGLINAAAGDVSIRRGMSTTNRIRIASANIYADTNLTVAGNLTVQGDTTTLNVGTLDVEDKNITLNKGSGDTSGSANGAGITIQDAVDASTDATFLWNNSTDNFELSHGLRMDNASHVLLERGGELRSLDTSSATKTIARVNSSNELEFGWSSSGPVKFMGGGSYTERMRVHTNSNIGIADADPVAKLTVTGPRILVQRTDDDASISFANNATGSVSGPTWSIGRNYSNSEAFTFAYHASSIPSLESSVAVIRTNGFFGLGTTTPLDLLHLKSSSTDARAMIDGHTGYDAELKFAENGTVKYTVGHDAASDNFVIGTTNVDTQQRFVISSAGNVGIGTTSPLSPLSVQADGIGIRLDGTANTTRKIFFRSTTSSNPAEIYADGTLKLWTEDSGTSINLVPKNGYLNIGDSNADYFLTLDKPATGTNGILFKNAGNNKGKILLDSNENLQFYVNNTTNAMTILESGYIGMGISPTTRLHMKGTGDMIRLESTNSGAGGAQIDMLHFSASPADGDTQAAINMGGYYSGTSSAYFAAIRCIGTNVGGKEGKLAFYTRDDSSWAQRFGITHTGVLETLMGVGSDNVALGNGALSSSSFNGDNVTAIGQNAGAAHTTGIRCTYVGNDAGDACTTGNDNTAIGQAALSTNITGAYNTAVGRAALNASTTSYNTAVGYHALVSQSTGAANTAVGAQTLDALDTGSNNTAVGYEAAGKLTSGYDNTGIGRAAMLDNTNGHSNTAIGVEALENNSSGNEIVAIGKHAGRNLTGSATTAIGFRAANNVTSSQESVYIGSDCAYSAGTGNRNVAVGNNAGYNWTSAYNNTNVGYNARSDEYNSYGSINLGYSVTGRGSTWVTFGHGSDYTAVAIGSTNWSSSSDERMKENIQASTAGLSFINDLRPVTFDFKMKKDIPNTLEAYEENSEKRHNELNPLKKHGFVAQEVKTALDNHSEVLDGSEIWSESKDGTQGVSMIAMIPMLVKSIQELKAENDSLKTRIETLEG